MADLRFTFALLAATTLVAQTHSHPAVSSNHNHRNNRVRELDFGIFERSTGATGRITMPATAGAQPVVSSVAGGTLNLLNGISAGPATYFIDLQIYDGSETTWETRDRSGYSRRVTLTRSGGSEILYCYLDARSNPWRGTYPFPPFATMRSENFHWGGYVQITNPNQAAGIYTGNTSSLNIRDTNFDGTYTGFVLTEDWCAHGDDYGTSGESPDFAIRIELRTPPPPLTVTPVSSLHFGTFLRPATAGTASVSATTGDRTTAGGLTGVPLNPVHARARYNLSGGANRFVQFVIPDTATLQNAAGDTLTVSFANAWAVTGAAASGVGGQTGSTGFLRLSNTTPGTATFWLGGTLSAAANQPGGDYSGTYPITFAYR